MDAYELYFVFHAFITVYEETGDKKALTAAEKLADYFLQHFGSGKLEFWPSTPKSAENKQKHLDGQSEFAGHSIHYSWEGTLLCDPVARLYEITGKKKYLNWSQLGSQQHRPMERLGGLLPFGFRGRRNFGSRQTPALRALAYFPHELHGFPPPVSHHRRQDPVTQSDRCLG